MKYLYRHLFLDDTFKKARPLKKLDPPNCGKDNSQVPGIQLAKFGLWLNKTLSCVLTVSILFLLEELPSYSD